MKLVKSLTSDLGSTQNRRPSHFRIGSYCCWIVGKQVHRFYCCWDRRDAMKKRYDLGLPDLTPDLEWMLSSGQVSSSLLLEKLLQDYYPKISQFAISILNERALAEKCAQDTFVKAMLSVHKFSSEAGVEIWLYQIAWGQCQKATQQQKARLLLGIVLSPFAKRGADETAHPENPLDAHLWQTVDGLGELPRTVLILSVLHGWSAEVIGAVVGASTVEIQARFGCSLASDWGEPGEYRSGRYWIIRSALPLVFSSLACPGCRRVRPRRAGSRYQPAGSRQAEPDQAGGDNPGSILAGRGGLDSRSLPVLGEVGRGCASSLPESTGSCRSQLNSHYNTTRPVGEQRFACPAQIPPHPCADPDPHA